jgi:hypothetical protein
VNDPVKSPTNATGAGRVETTPLSPGATRAKEARELNQKMIDTLATLTVGSVERARVGAQFLQTAASAIAVLYTGLLGAIFVADQAAPTRSIIPLLFLGAAITLATAYLAFVGPGKGISRPRFDNVPSEDPWVRLDYINTWVREVTLPRAWALRGGVVTILIAVLFLPVPIIQFPTGLPLLTALHIAADSAPAATSPSPRPSIAWPSPPALPDPSLAAVLYAVQLDQFRKELPPTAKSTDTATEANRDRFAGVLAVIGGLIAGIVMWDPRGWFKARRRRRLAGRNTVNTVG